MFVLSMAGIAILWKMGTLHRAIRTVYTYSTHRQVLVFSYVLASILIPITNDNFQQSLGGELGTKMHYTFDSFSVTRL